MWRLFRSLLVLIAMRECSRAGLQTHTCPRVPARADESASPFAGFEETFGLREESGSSRFVTSAGADLRGRRISWRGVTYTVMFLCSNAQRAYVKGEASSLRASRSMEETWMFSIRLVWNTVEIALSTAVGRAASRSFGLIMTYLERNGDIYILTHIKGLLIFESEFNVYLSKWTPFPNTHAPSNTILKRKLRSFGQISFHP